METNRKRIPLVAMLIAAVVGLTGCGSAGEANSSAEKDSERLNLTVGLMPAVDAAPILYAEENGYFKDLGLEVELQIFNNPQDRQSALQTQAIDGAMTDLVAVALNVDSGFDIKATTMTNGVFPLLSNQAAAEKTDVKAVLMEVSVTNFLTDDYLGDQYQVEKVYINDIPARLAALQSGQVDLGLFPEPVASMGELAGLKKELSQPVNVLCPDVMVFTGKALSEKSEAIQLFHQAYDKAVDELNSDPEKARDILMEKIPNLKPEIRDRIILPVYTKAALQDEQYIGRIIDWTSEVMKKDLHITAADLTERKYTE